MPMNRIAVELQHILTFYVVRDRAPIRASSNNQALTGVTHVLRIEPASQDGCSRLLVLTG